MAKLYQAGLQTFRSLDPLDQAPMPYALFYPSVGEEQPFSRGPFVFSVVRNGELASGRFGLIIVSHGAGGTHYDHHDSCEALARAGYVVAALQHPRSNVLDNAGGRRAAVCTGRSRQVSHMIDAVLALDEFGAAIDQSRIGIMGFSLGGYTALTAIGGVPDVDKLRAHQRQNREFDTQFVDAGVLAQDPDVTGHLEVTHDRRFKAAVLLAPACGVMFGQAELAKVSVPVRLYRGERDMVLRHPFHCEEIRRNLPQAPEYKVIDKAGHYAFLAPFSEVAAKDYPDFAKDAPGFNRRLVHQEINREVVDFFDRILTVGNDGAAGDHH